MMITPDEWKTRFEAWWRVTPTCDMSLGSRRIAGTTADVYTSIIDEGRCVAIKTVAHDSADVMHDNCMLFSEYHIHERVQRLYKEEGRRQRLVPVYWVRKIRLHGRTVVAFAMERIRETWYNRACGTELPRAWKEEVLFELTHWNRKWGFFHRDPHLNNLGILPSGDWCIFDVSMAAFIDGTTVYNEEAFYDSNDHMAFHRDGAIFTYSWCVYQKDVATDLIKDAWRRSKPHAWPRRTPVVIRNCPLARRGRFREVQGDRVRCVVKIPNNHVSRRGLTCRVHGIPHDFEVQQRSRAHTSIVLDLDARHVVADVEHAHIAYYLFDT